MCTPSYVIFCYHLQLYISLFDTNDEQTLIISCSLGYCSTVLKCAVLLTWRCSVDVAIQRNETIAERNYLVGWPTVLMSGCQGICVCQVCFYSIIIIIIIFILLCCSDGWSVVAVSAVVVQWQWLHNGWFLGELADSIPCLKASVAHLMSDVSNTVPMRVQYEQQLDRTETSMMRWMWFMLKERWLRELLRLEPVSVVLRKSGISRFGHDECNKCSAVAEMGDRLATIDIGRKLGAVPLCGRGSLVPILRNVARAEAYPHAKFNLDTSNHLATVHQRYRQTDRTGRQRSDSIERTVLQTFAQRWHWLDQTL